MNLIKEDYLKLGTEERVNKIFHVLNKRQTTLTIVLENINDPHNVSACVRSCDAVGISEICLIYHGGQEFRPLGERSSASARKWVDLKFFTSVDECFSQLRNEGKKIYTTHMAKDSVSLYSLELAEPVALVFGNEHAGVSEEAVAKADGNFLIPQVGMIQSLNISVACAVSLYEAFRQRNEKGMYDLAQIQDSDFDARMVDWIRR
jgi:tRNA (guanosine-2'-O-)-methyltransferase